MRVHAERCCLQLDELLRSNVNYRLEPVVEEATRYGAQPAEGQLPKIMSRKNVWFFCSPSSLLVAVFFRCCSLFVPLQVCCHLYVVCGVAVQAVSAPSLLHSY